MIVWCKKPKGRGLGGTFGISTEYLLFARRGSLKNTSRFVSTWVEHKRLKHSQKPPVFRQLIVGCFTGTRLELFAREKTEGWDVWGNEVENDISLTPHKVKGE
jgi:N6-adenosine-specific RNA methylase IME4